MKKKFNWRGFVSVYITYTFLVMTITGIVLYFSPPGRVAHWSEWKFLGLIKEEWQAIHTIFTFVFIGFTGFHIYFNWKPLINYLRTKMDEVTKLRRELTYSTILFLVILVMTIAALPPFSSVMDFGEYLSDSWSNEETEPPVPHAEEMSVFELAEVTGKDPYVIWQAFAKNSVTVSDSSISLGEIAIENNTTPNTLYGYIRSGSSKVNIDETTTTDDSTEHTVIKAGYGRMTLEQLASQLSMNTEDALDRLQKNNISAETDEKVKDIAVRYDLLPMDIVNILEKK